MSIEVQIGYAAARSDSTSAVLPKAELTFYIKNV